MILLRRVALEASGAFLAPGETFFVDTLVSASQVLELREVEILEGWLPARTGRRAAPHPRADDVPPRTPVWATGWLDVKD